MPARNGKVYNTGWVPGQGFVENGNIGLYPEDLSVSSRYPPLPGMYKATKNIELLPGFESGTGTDEFTAEIVTQTVAGVGGTPQPGGQGSYESYGYYRYGFNGKENDNEVKGAGNQLDYGDRAYDSRIGRWLSIDKMPKVDLTPYQFSVNNPIIFIDNDGKDEYLFHSNGTWSVKRSKGPDLFKKQDTEKGPYRILNSTLPTNFNLSMVGKLEDLNYISQYSLDNSSFNNDINKHQGEEDALDAHNELAAYAWGYTIVSGYDKATDILSFGGKKIAKEQLAILAVAHKKEVYKAVKDVNGKFGRYKITFEDAGVYVGKTIRDFKKRLQEHMRGQFKDWKIEKIEVQPLNTDKKKLKEHEGEWYDEAKEAGEKILNKIRPNQIKKKG